ncbi:HAD-IIB family hydrolase [Auraticoccus sp. F435]|uniref:HAD-IIB family hydrolase n=1 Tax=Auraticoccus cholistanensis TaxID=2656650 RepID=A0A6A9V1M0_9ACTN|nr:HAD-IIB family hydrolase [Auraticoccus cholistanensis]
MSGWRPRLVVSDLDGTFLSPDGTVSDVNAAAVADALAAGIEVLFATGRPPGWLGVIADLGLSSTVVIASNGALVYDVASERVLRRRSIPQRSLETVVADLVEALPGLRFGVEDGFTFRCTPDYVFRAGNADRVRRVGREELVGQQEAVKLLAQHEELAPDELAAVVAPVVGDRLTVTHSAIDGWGLLEMSGPGVTKASTLAAWCDERGIAADEVAAFGDMPNDRAMLEWVGRPHVMAHAHPSLADLRATVVGSNLESAVGRTIRSWL